MDPLQVQVRKSSYSEFYGFCVEIGWAHNESLFVIADSKKPKYSPRIVILRAVALEFISQIKAGLIDLSQPADIHIEVTGEGGYIELEYVDNGDYVMRGNPGDLSGLEYVSHQFNTDEMQAFIAGVRDGQFDPTRADKPLPDDSRSREPQRSSA